MTSDEQRKAFEAWLCPYDDDAMKRMTLERRGDGNYAQALPRLQWKVWQAATAAERERCAKVCDFMAKLGAEDRMHGAVVVATELAAAIRKG